MVSCSVKLILLNDYLNFSNVYKYLNGYYLFSRPHKLSRIPRPSWQRWALDWTWIGLDWTGSGLWRILLILDWIRTIANFVKFGLDPDCKSLHNFGTGPALNWVMEKKCGISVVKRLPFLNFWDLIWSWTYIWNKFWTVVGLGLSFKKVRTGSQSLTVRSSLLLGALLQWMRDRTQKHQNLSILTGFVFTGNRQNETNENIHKMCASCDIFRRIKPRCYFRKREVKGNHVSRAKSFH